MNVKDFYENYHVSFGLSNEPVTVCNNDNDDSILNLGIDPDLFDVSSFILTDYFELNPDELEKILNEGSNFLNEKSFNIENINKSKLTDVNKEESTSKDDINKINPVYMNSSVFIDEVNTHTSSESIELFKNDIKQYIKRNLAKYYQHFYLRKYEDITNVINLLDEFIVEIKKQKFSFSLEDQELAEDLRIIVSKLGNNLIFDQKTFNLFKRELMLRTNISKKLFYRNWYLCTDKEKTLKFYYEFIKLYRYAYKIPELLILYKLLIGKLHVDLAFILHLIFIFIEQIGTSVENEVLIKFLIHNAFFSSFKNKLNLFLVPKLNIKCHINHSNINFFSWEINREIRQRIKQKTKENYNYEVDNIVQVHIKVVLLSFLYQHIIFLKCHRITIGDLNTLINFFKRVEKSEECVMCIFDDFLELIRSQTDKNK